MPRARRSSDTASLSIDVADRSAGHDAVAELLELQGDYQTWLDALPENLRDSATADALHAVCELDLSELVGAELPLGFGRD